MSLHHNERTKLLANALDRASTASLTVGVLAPVAAAFYNVGGNRVSTGTLILGAVVWILAAVSLHLLARWALGDLKS